MNKTLSPEELLDKLIYHLANSFEREMQLELNKKPGEKIDRLFYRIKNKRLTTDDEMAIDWAKKWLERQPIYMKHHTEDCKCN